MKKNISFSKKITIAILLLIINVSFIPLASSTPTNQIFKTHDSQNRENIIENSIITTNSEDTEYYAVIAACTDYKNDKYNIPKKPFPPIPEYKLKFLYNSLLNAENWDENNIILLLNEDAAKQKIIDAFEQMAVIVGPEDIFLFSWSGHGSKVLDDDGDESSIDPNDEYDEVICPFDIEYVDGNLTNFIRDDELDRYFSEIHAKGMCLIFESCLSGGLVDKDKTFEKDLSSSGAYVLDIDEDNRVVIMSTLPGTLGRASYLTGFPLIASLAYAFNGHANDLDNNGFISVEEAFKTARLLTFAQSSGIYAFNWIYTYYIYKNEMYRGFGGLMGLLFGEYPAIVATLVTLRLFIQIQQMIKSINGHYLLNWPNMRDDYEGDLPIIAL